MSFTPSKIVESNQEGPHQDLTNVLTKHRDDVFQKPIADHTRQAFDALQEKLISNDLPLILDAGCGTGDSTRRLAQNHPECLVIGIDRSHTRLSKEREAVPINTIFLRADLVDFYRLCTDNNLKVEKHYLFYPNPYPKAAHLKRRWHAHPIFPDLLKVSSQIELRTNWEIYAQEFSAALTFFSIKNEIIEKGETDDPVSPFEAKYLKSGQTAYIVKTN